MVNKQEAYAAIPGMGMVQAAGRKPAVREGRLLDLNGPKTLLFNS